MRRGGGKGREQHRPLRFVWRRQERVSGITYLVLSNRLTTLLETERGKTSIDLGIDLLRSTNELIIMVDLSASGAQAEVGELRAGSDIGTSCFISMRSRRRKQRKPTRDSDVRSANLRDGRGEDDSDGGQGGDDVGECYAHSGGLESAVKHDLRVWRSGKLYEEDRDDQRCWDLGERVSVRLQSTLLDKRKEDKIGDAGRGMYVLH
jgi:hypothetical protein